MTSRTRVSFDDIVIEADGPVTITFGAEQPVPDLIPNTDEQYDLGPSATPLTPMDDKPEKKRRKAKSHRQTCAHCFKTFLARTTRTRFCCDRHRHAWLRERGYTYPLPKAVTATSLVDDEAKGLHIKAGATGVSVKEEPYRG